MAAGALQALDEADVMTVTQRLHAVLRPFVLRRTKEEVRDSWVATLTEEY
jgi:SNF2 family DNA or RNA helicase